MRIKPPNADCLMRLYGAHKGAILILWIVATAVCAFFAADLMKSTVPGVLAPEDSPSARASALLWTYFPLSFMADSVAVCIEGPPGTNFTRNASAFIAMEREGNKFWTRSHIGTVEVVGYESIAADPALKNWAKTQIFSPVSGRAGRLLFVHVGNPGQSLDFGRLAGNYAHEMTARYPGFNVGAVGVSALFEEAVEGAAHDVGHLDVVVVPMAFLVLAMVVGSWRLILIPIVQFVTVLIISLAIMDLVTHYIIPVTSITPNLMISLGTALTIDYALFLQSRFTEELRALLRKQAQEESQAISLDGRGKALLPDADTESIRLALTTSIRTSGKTIVGSGCTLMFGFISLMFFPSFLQSLGLGAAVVVFVSIIANLSIGPCLMLYFPNFFSKKACCGPIGRYFSQRIAHIRQKKLRCCQGEVWYVWARLTTQRSSTIFVIIALIILAVLCAPVLWSMKLSASVNAMIPRYGAAARSVDLMSRYFGAALIPYTLLFVPKNGDVFDYDVWHEMDSQFRLAKSMMPPSPLNRFDGPLEPIRPNVTSELQRKLLRECFYHQDQCKERVQWVFDQYPPEVQDEIAVTVPRMFPQFVASNGRAMNVVLLPGALETGSTDALINGRQLREAISSQEHVELHIIGLDLLDTMDAIYDSLPTVAAVTSLIVLTVIGALYRSVVIPLRSVVTISGTMLIGFTVMVGVFQNAWCGEPRPKGVHFLVPPLGLCIVLGLSLDYDVFLLGRIVDSRLEGYSATSSIELGVWRTGKIITSVGVIMTIAFVGTAVSTIPLLAQLGLLLCVCVVADTFLVRPLITPALMAPLGEMNWWPRKVPVPQRSISDDETLLSDMMQC